MAEGRRGNAPAAASFYVGAANAEAPTAPVPARAFRTRDRHDTAYPFRPAAFLHAHLAHLRRLWPLSRRRTTAEPLHGVRQAAARRLRSGLDPRAFHARGGPPPADPLAVAVSRRDAG